MGEGDWRISADCHFHSSVPSSTASPCPESAQGKPESPFAQCPTSLVCNRVICTNTLLSLFETSQYSLSSQLVRVFFLMLHMIVVDFRLFFLIYIAVSFWEVQSLRETEA